MAKCVKCGAEYPLNYLAWECAERDRATVVQLPVIPRFEVAVLRPCEVCDGEMPTNHQCTSEALRG